LDEIPISYLLLILGLLVIISGFFSGSETGLMTLNRYRLRNLVDKKHPGAIRASKLLQRPDKLIGLILIFNNFVNLLAASLSTIIALRIIEDYQLDIGTELALAISTGILTFIILLFAEVTPKTLAALRSEKYAFPATRILGPLLWLFYPVVWVINVLSNSMLHLIGVSPKEKQNHSLSSEELRTVVIEAGAMIPKRRQKMLINILDLERVTVDDIMVPRGEIYGIDLNSDWDDIADQLHNSLHTRMPAYFGEIDNVAGVVHVRNVLPLIQDDEFNEEAFMRIMHDPYFVPEGTPLTIQLINFQREMRRIALVVDEYGDIQGLVTLEDILEEIVGEFTSDPAMMEKDIHPQQDGTYLIDGSVSIRDLNKALKIKLPIDGPKTLNGLILEYLENIPESGTSLLLGDIPVEIMQIKENKVKIAKFFPALKHQKTTDEVKPGEDTEQ